MLMEPFLNLGHNKDGDDNRDNVALVSNPLDRTYHIIADLNVTKQIPGRNLSVCHAEECVDGLRITCVPCIQQGSMNHHQTHNGAEENVASEYSGCTDRYDNRQESR